MPISRRRLLTALLAAPFSSLAKPVEATPTPPSPLSHLFSDPAALRSVAGRLRRRSDYPHAHEARLARLMNRPPASLDRLRERLAARIAADFAAERLVLVDGWVLTETEACLVVLAAGG